MMPLSCAECGVSLAALEAGCRSTGRS